MFDLVADAGGAFDIVGFRLHRRTLARRRLQGPVGRLMEGRDEIADLNLVAVAQRRTSLEEFVVDAGAVPALHVLHVEPPLDADDAGVLPADGSGRDDEVTRRAAAHYEGVGVQRDPLTLV